LLPSPQFKLNTQETIVMKFVTPTRLLATGLILATFGLTVLAKLSSDEPGVQRCATENYSRTLVLEDAAGNVRRLVHSPAQGWKFVGDAEPADGMRAFERMKLSVLPSAHALESAPTSGNSSDAQPLAVFIDGPTGYTFAWTGENGWRFIGHISEEHP
jgi:hypothetical protein